MKQIDVLTKYFHPVTAGIEVNIRKTYAVLAKNGWQVNIHTTNDTYLEKGILPKNAVLDSLNIFRYPFYGSLIGYFPDIDLSATDIVALHNFNVYYVWILIYFLALKILGKKKFLVVITPHGGFNPEWRVFSKFQAFCKSLYHKTLGVFLINRVADGIRAVSEWEAKEMVKQSINPAKIKVVTNGLEDEAYMDVEKLASDKVKNKVKGFGKYIFQNARVYPIKNFETVLMALSKLPPEINYVIVGAVADSNYYAKLKKIINELGLNKRVFFYGLVYGVDKYYLNKHALMVVHMAIWESFCNVVHEGLSQGKVCIVANNTALPYLIKDGVNGFLVDTYASEKLAEKINYVYKNINSTQIKKIEALNKNVSSNESYSSVAGRIGSWYTQLAETI